MEKGTFDVLLDLAEFIPLYILKLHIIVHQVEVLALQGEDVVPLHVVEGFLARQPAGVHLDDGDGLLAVRRVDLNFEGIAGEGEDFFFEDEARFVV